MAQVKIYGRRAHLAPNRQQLSDAVHSCLVDALGVPQDKRFQRFIALDDADFIHPGDRTDRYTIIEISMFAGRSDDAKRKLIRLLYQRCAAAVTLRPQDLEITIFETPRANWGIRGVPADELALEYRLGV